MTFGGAEKKNWVKNWAMNCGVVFCSFYGDLYTKQITKYLGKKFDNTLYVYENGSSSQYLVEEELGKFADFLVNKVVEDEEIARKWCKVVKGRTDSIMALLDKIEEEKELSLTDFEKLKEEVYSHIPPNLAIKRIADFLPPKLAERFLEDFRQARIYTEPVYNRVEAAIRKFNKQVSKEQKIDEELLQAMTFVEMETYFKTKKLPDEKILLQRRKGSAFYYKNGEYTEFTGKKFVELKESLGKPKQEGVILGKKACGGQAKGIARIVVDPHKVKQFDSGDVLVTGMTRPEFVPLMQLASAIVTDAGGVLCHAAIIAREINKPCVIGTNIATKAIKDGDLVEVDADKGIIRIIKKKN